MVVGVSLIKLHESEFGVVACVKSLVAEYSADFINSFKTAYDETLQVKLKRNTELKILVERVEVSLETVLPPRRPRSLTSIGVSTSMNPCESR